MKFFILTFFLSISLFASSIEWHENYEKALLHAKKENKPLFVFMTSKDCKFCTKLKETTLQDKKIVDTINKNYSSVIVMKDKDFYPKKLNDKATPMIYFLDNNENIIDYSLGYWDSVDFSFTLKDIDRKIKKRKKQ